MSQTDKGYTGQRSEAGMGLMDYNARFYSTSLGRFISPDSLIPGPGDPLSWDRFSYVRGNPIKYTDPSGQDVGCSAADPKCKNQNTYTHTELLFSFDTKAIAEEIIPFTPDQLRDWAMNIDCFALGVDALAEVIVLGHVGVGIVDGTTLEGNPVSGIPSGAGAGWILGETNPIVQSLVTLGNVSATATSTSSILADVKSGDSQLNLQVSKSGHQIAVKGNASVSSNSLASGYLTTLGWVTRVVEGSLAIQGAAVMLDHGLVPTHIFSIPLSMQFSSLEAPTRDK